MTETPIDPVIADEEPLARGIVHPLMYSFSKKRLKEVAFKPPPGRNDVSALRLTDTNADFCKNHFKSLVVGHHVYCGIALIRTGDVRAAHSQLQLTYPNERLPKTEVLFTPLDKKGEIRKDLPVFADDEGLPMHADIVYDFIPKPEMTTPLTIRKIARALANQPPAKFFEDPDPALESWAGKDLTL